MRARPSDPDDVPAVRRAWLLWPVMMLAVASLLSLGPGLGLVPALLTHFQFYLALGWLAVGVFAAWSGHRQRRRGHSERSGTRLSGRLPLVPLLAVAGLGWHGHLWASLWIPVPVETSALGGGELKVMWANVQARGARVEALQTQVKAYAPDILALGEVPDQNSLQALQQDWPESLLALEHGLALYSRLPLLAAEVIEVPGARPILAVDFDYQGQLVRLLATHALIPVLSAHEATFERCCALGAEGDSCILIGDLNTTPWSPQFKRLQLQAGLADARQGYGPQATWASSRWPGIRLPIDHVLYRGPLVVKNWEVGNDFGSDHLAVMATFGRRH